MFPMTDIKFGPRERIRESTWLICEAARVLCELGEQLGEDEKDELLHLMQAQAERLSSAVGKALENERQPAGC